MQIRFSCPKGKARKKRAGADFVPFLRSIPPPHSPPRAQEPYTHADGARPFDTIRCCPPFPFLPTSFSYPREEIFDIHLVSQTSLLLPTGSFPCEALEKGESKSTERAAELVCGQSTVKIVQQFFAQGTPIKFGRGLYQVYCFSSFFAMYSVLVQRGIR